MKSSRNVIKQDEWLGELAKAEEGELDPDAVTITDACAQWECGRHAAKRRLEDAVRDGRAVRVRKRDQSGRLCLAYKPAPKGKK